MVLGRAHALPFNGPTEKLDSGHQCFESFGLPFVEVFCPIFKRLGHQERASPIVKISTMLTLFGKRFDKLKVRVLLASVIVIAGSAFMLFDSVMAAKQRINESVERDLVSHSQSTLVSLVEAFNLVDYTLKRGRQEWLETGNLRPHGEFIQDFPNFRELIVQVAVIGADGYLEDSSITDTPTKVYLGDRDHFKVHQNSKSDTVFISKPLIGKVSGVKTLQFTRPIFKGSGEFAGVIVASLNPHYLSQVTFDSIATAGLVATIVGKDGYVRVVSRGTNEESIQANVHTYDLNGSAASVGDIEPYLWRKSTIGGLGISLFVGYPVEKIGDRLLYVTWATTFAFFVMMVLIVWYTTGIFRLISTRTNLLLELEESNVKANSANAMKSKFVAGISHELRTPLNGILGFAELVGMSDSLEEAKKYGKVIHGSADHLHHLVNTLLDLAKIEAGQMSLVYTESKTWELFDSVVSLHRYEAEKKGLLLSLNISQESPKLIKTDRIKLMQVMNNLINNAVKFTETGAIFVNVNAKSNQWEISVVDTGVGMSPQQMSGIFDRFNNIKLESINTSDKQGAGLGMALCKELIELMNGTIKLQSELNVGTSVKIELPRGVNENTV